jgi:hypothetical protein
LPVNNHFAPKLNFIESAFAFLANQRTLAKKFFLRLLKQLERLLQKKRTSA